MSRRIASLNHRVRSILLLKYRHRRVAQRAIHRFMLELSFAGIDSISSSRQRRCWRRYCLHIIDARLRKPIKPTVSSRERISVSRSIRQTEILRSLSSIYALSENRNVFEEWLSDRKKLEFDERIQDDADAGARLEAGTQRFGGSSAAQGRISFQEQHGTRVLQMRRGNTRIRSRWGLRCDGKHGNGDSCESPGDAVQLCGGALRHHFLALAPDWGLDRAASIIDHGEITSSIERFASATSSLRLIFNYDEYTQVLISTYSAGGPNSHSRYIRWLTMAVMWIPRSDILHVKTLHVTIFVIMNIVVQLGIFSLGMDHWMSNETSEIAWDQIVARLIVRPMNRDGEVNGFLMQWLHNRVCSIQLIRRSWSSLSNLSYVQNFSEFMTKQSFLQNLKASKRFLI